MGMQIGKRIYDTQHMVYIMGILNVTPDSFSDGGKFNSMDKALYRTEEMIQEGASIIDVGGESTRPGYEPVTEQEEIQRIIPIIEEIKKRFDVEVSVDTYKSKVAEAAIQVGVDLVNDIWGLKADKNMAKVIAQHQVACCLMHNREELLYQDLINDVTADLKQSLELAKEAGIARERIMLDPGIGFAKSYEQNLQMIKQVGRLKELGYPILLGTSRKSVIGLTLEADKEERLEGTLVTSVYGVQQGCSFLRVHDIKENVRAVKMTMALMRS